MAKSRLNGMRRIAALFKRRRTPAPLAWQEFVGLPSEALLTREAVAGLLEVSAAWVKKWGIPRVRLGHKTVRYRAGTVRRCLRNFQERI